MTIAGKLIFTVVILEVLYSQYDVTGQSVPLNSSIQINSSFPVMPDRITALCPDGWLQAWAVRPGYELSRYQLCVKLNEPLRRWRPAVDQCRTARGFMVKLDSTVMLKETPLFDYLRQKDVTSVWSGMHHKYGTLVWDDMHSTMVKAYTGAAEIYGWSRRGYAFNETSYILGENTCGHLTLARNQSGSTGQAGLQRQKRSSSSDTNKVKPSAAAPKSSAGDRPRQGNPTQGDDDGPAKHSQSDPARPLSPKNNASNKTATPKTLQVTTQTTTPDQSDLEDSDHPGPTTLRPPLGGNTTPTTAATQSQKQSAKGTSLPSSTVAMTTADPQGSQNPDEFLYNPSSDMSLDSSHVIDMAAQDEMHRKSRDPETAMDSQVPRAVQAKSAVLSSESVESSEYQRTTSPKPATKAKINATASTTATTTLLSSTTSTAGATTAASADDLNNSSASVVLRTTLRLPPNPNMTVLAADTTLDPPVTESSTASIGLRYVDLTTADVENSNENSDQASSESTTASILLTTLMSEGASRKVTGLTWSTTILELTSVTSPTEATTVAGTSEQVSLSLPTKKLESMTTPTTTSEFTTRSTGILVSTIVSTTTPTKTSASTTSQATEDSAPKAQSAHVEPVSSQPLAAISSSPVQTTESITTEVPTDRTTTLGQTTPITSPGTTTSQTTVSTASKASTSTIETTHSTTSTHSAESITTAAQTKESAAAQDSLRYSTSAPNHTTNFIDNTEKPIRARGESISNLASNSLSKLTSSTVNDSTPVTSESNATNLLWTLQSSSDSESQEMQANSESQDSSMELQLSFDQDIFPVQTGPEQNPPASSKTPRTTPLAPQGDQAAANQDDGARGGAQVTGPPPLLEPQQATQERDFRNRLSVTPPVAPADVMSLGDCDEERASVCVTEAIEKLSLVSHCERYWYGHRLLDRCYRPLTIALTERDARDQCLRQGAALAAAETDFYGNITAILQDMFVADRMTGKRIWLDTSLNFNLASGNGLCSALENGQILRTSCSSMLPFICQKDAEIVRTAEDFRDKLEAMTYIQNMTSFQPQALPCPLGMTAFDDVIVWFKDGRPIDDASDDDVTSFGPKNGELPNSLGLDLSILRRVGETNPVFLQPAMLQGEYWCEIWRKEPFKRVSSNKIYLKFTDVITLRGVIFTEPISYKDASIFNRLGQRVGVPGAMEKRLEYMNKNIRAYLQRVHPIVRDVFTFIKNVSASDGRSEFVTYICTVAGDLASNVRGDVTQTYLSAFFDALVRNQDIIRSEWNLTSPLFRAVSISMTDLCPETKLVDIHTNITATFPRTPVNTQAYSLDYCGAHSGVAYCKGNLQTAAYWDSVSIKQSCLPHNSASSSPVPGSVINQKKNTTTTTNTNTNSSNNNGSVATITDSAAGAAATTTPAISTRTTDIIPVPSTDHLELIEKTTAPSTTNGLNSSQVSDLLSQMLNQTSNLTYSDIHTVAHLVNNLASDNKVSTREVGELLVQTVNKVLDAPPEELMKAEEENHAPSKLLADLEQFGAKVDMEDQPRFRYVTPNVAMELWNLNSYNDVVIGFGATETNSWLEPLEEPRIVTIKNRTWSEQNLPGFDVAIELPESLVKNTTKHYKDFTNKPLRLTMFLYRKTSAFLPSNMAETPAGDVNSAIISASLAGQKIRDLQERVRLVFKPFRDAKNREEETKCVFWDTVTYANPTWSTAGCTYNGTLNGRDVCLCNHLTNFAILLDFYGDEKAISPANETSLSVLTLIGTSLSIFGLAITIITFLAFKKLRQGRAQQTLFNMAVALLCFQTTFLVGVKQTSIKSVCMTVSVLLHYFILVSFAWMLIEAVLQYLTFVKVLGTYISKYTLKTVLCAWGFPLIPVVAVLATDYNLYYGRANYCWMSLHAFYYAFALPVGIIIVFNSIMFFIIIVSLITRPKGLRSNQSSNKTRETNLKATFTIFVLLGLTWLFGYFAIEDARVVFQYVFTILSSLQGFLIFILMVVRRKQVRELWKATCCDRRQAHRGCPQKKQLSPASSSSMSSNNSLSNSSRTLPSFINHAYSGDSLVLKPGLRRENSVSI